MVKCNMSSNFPPINRLVLLMFMTLLLNHSGVDLHIDKGIKQKFFNVDNSFYEIFETLNNTKINSNYGGTATLPCEVEIISDATVTWTRRKDYSLLTVGTVTYSTDERFYVEHVRHKGIWNLRIKNVQKDDEGIYECSVSSWPPQSIFVEVQVIEAYAEIVGQPDMLIDEGSSLILECRIFQATERPTFVFWYHGEEMVNFNTQDGYYVKSSKTSDLQTSEDSDKILSNLPIELNNRDLVTTSSILYVEKVEFSHAGNFTCAPSNTKATSINVHVLKDRPAAMKHSNSSASHSSNTSSNRVFELFNFYILYHTLRLINFI